MTRPLQPDDRQTTFSAPAADDRATSYPPLDDRATIAPPSEPTPPPPPPGEWAPDALVLRGQYRLETRLRGGAQAMAFRGTRVLDGAAVFIKIQPNPTGRAGVFAKQIGLRDKLLAIRHPNLLRCLDLALEGDALCEVYEWLDGRELTALLGGAGEDFDDARVRNMVSQLAEAIHQLHAATSLSHRDLKPDNVRVIERNGREQFVIVDYGTVSQLDSGGATTVAGTRVYSPPEFYQRRIPNDPLLGTWDWWSLGRIVQEAIDRIHPYDRLSRLFAADLHSGKYGPDARVAVELLFDTIMLENERSHYGVRAGMVEFTEADGRMPRWLPLLRGLLTSRRRSRWGYEDVERFLRGEKVPDSYGAAVDVEGFEFDRYVLTLPELARKLMAESAPDTPAGAARWAEAIDIVYRGRLSRYVSGTLQDSDLLKELRECQRVEDHDLGTALALTAISEGAVPPAVRGVEINARYLLAEAARLPDEVPPPERVATLLSPGFQERLKRWHPENAAQLEQESARLGGFGDTCKKLGVKTTLFGMGTVLRVLHTPDEELISMVVTARQRLFQSDLEALNAAFHEPQLERLTPFELRAVALSLLQPAKHSFMTHEDRASGLKRSAEALRDALALRTAALCLHPVLGVFHGSFKWLAFWASLVFTISVIYVTDINTVREPGFRYAAKWFLMVVAGVAAGLLYASMRYMWMREVKKFASRFMDLGGQPVSYTLLKNVSQRLGGRRPGKELARLNAEIRTVPNIDHQAWVVAPAQTGALGRALGIQLGVVAALYLGVWRYTPLFVQKRPVMAYRDPLPGSTTKQPFGAKSAKRTPKARPPASVPAWPPQGVVVTPNRSLEEVRRAEQELKEILAEEARKNGNAARR